MFHAFISRTIAFYIPPKLFFFPEGHSIQLNHLPTPMLSSHCHLAAPDIYERWGTILLVLFCHPGGFQYWRGKAICDPGLWVPKIGASIKFVITHHFTSLKFCDLYVVVCYSTLITNFVHNETQAPQCLHFPSFLVPKCNGTTILLSNPFHFSHLHFLLSSPWKT